MPVMKVVNGMPVPERQWEPAAAHGVCPTCKRPIDITRYCADCGATFLVTFKDQAFFASRKLELPKRCQECRKARKQLRQKGA